MAELSESLVSRGLKPLAGAQTPAAAKPRRFEFDRDTFAFANELVWEYHFDPATRKAAFIRREPKPNYTHHCFVLARAARQFLYHARFDPDGPVVDDGTYRRLVREIISRNPRTPCDCRREIVVPGYESLRLFSQDRERLLKSECGGAWRSYTLRSHWRMVFPISRCHQARTADRLAAAIRRDDSPIIHLVRFPRLSINHGMVLFGVTGTAEGLRFDAYDPNDPEQPTRLSFNASLRTFSLPANPYWAGGRVNIIEIYRSWFL
ncbi:MAG: hypothetical protein ACYDH9_09350 [Limisphaerales bacterium]